MTAGQVLMLIGVAFLAFGPPAVPVGYATAVGAVGFGFFATGLHIFRNGLTQEITAKSKDTDKLSERDGP